MTCLWHSFNAFSAVAFTSPSKFVNRFITSSNPLNSNFSFKTYGGTERDVNGVYSIEDTANIETWYRPDIKGNCRVAREDGATYDIIGEPENISMRNHYLL